MPNIVQALKSEIVRLSRKEIKASITPLRSSNVHLKKAVAELKRKVAVLEAENKRLSAFQNKQQANQPKVALEEAAKARVTSKSIHTLRTKLGLSQSSFAKLLGVSNQAVYSMEHKNGKLKLRSATLTNLLSVRGMGKREAKKRLEGI